MKGDDERRHGCCIEYMGGGAVTLLERLGGINAF
jgi:hypothetical protein